MKSWHPSWDLSTIPDQLLQSEAARRNVAKRKVFGGPQPVMHRCIWCKEEKTAREVRKHQGKCPMKPRI
jgi:hypothetical protein